MPSKTRAAKRMEPIRAPHTSILGDLEIEVNRSPEGQEFVQLRSLRAPGVLLGAVNIVVSAKHITVVDRRG